MMINRRFACFFVAATVLVCAAVAASQDASSDVRVELSTGDGATTFRIGDPITLVLSFTSDRIGQQVNVTTTEFASPIDEISLMPRTGVFYWLDDYSSNGRYAPDYMAMYPMSSHPTNVKLHLNDWVRFDQPGHYAVRVKTSRTSGKLTTNEVGFDIVPMSQPDEESEVKRITSELDATRDARTRGNIAQELEFLTGEFAAREKVRRYLDLNETSANYGANILYGLYISQNRKLVVQLLEEAFRNSSTSVTIGFLHTLADLRSKMDSNGAPTTNKVVSGEVISRKPSKYLDDYLKELVGSLPNRIGRGQTSAAITILTFLPDNTAEANSAYLKQVRSILVTHFNELNIYDQQYLLNGRWAQFRDPAIIPTLKRLLEKSPSEDAMKRLFELSPEEARPYLISAMTDPRHIFDIDLATSLQDSQLPEIDTALASQIKRLASTNRVPDGLILEFKGLLAARYATSSIYNDVLQTYQASSANLRPEIRAPLLSYLAKWNEPQAIPMIKKEVAGLSGFQLQFFLNNLTKEYYSDGLDGVVRDILSGDNAGAAATAAYIMSLHGQESDQELIKARLDRWISESKGKIESQTDTKDQAMTADAMVQVNLISALLYGKTWKASQEQARRLKESCLTNICREHFEYIK